MEIFIAFMLSFLTSLGILMFMSVYGDRKIFLLFHLICFPRSFNHSISLVKEEPQSSQLKAKAAEMINLIS